MFALAANFGNIGASKLVVSMLVADFGSQLSTNIEAFLYLIFILAEPPSYDSLFGRIRDTHKASRNFIDFLAKLLLLLLGTIGCTIACSVTVVIPICMIVIGSIHYNDCPAEPYIPLSLLEVRMSQNGSK